MPWAISAPFPAGLSRGEKWRSQRMEEWASRPALPSTAGQGRVSTPRVRQTPQNYKQGSDEIPCLPQYFLLPRHLEGLHFPAFLEVRLGPCKSSPTGTWAELSTSNYRQVIQSCPTLWDPMDYTRNSPGQNTGMVSRSLLQGNLPNPGIKSRSPTLQADSLPAEPQGRPKNTGVGNLSLLQQSFPTQESNWGRLHCRQILSQLSYREAQL